MKEQDSVPLSDSSIQQHFKSGRMSDFFRGWKRLIGVILLMLGILIMAISVCSEIYPQTMGDDPIVMYSRHGTLEAYRWNPGYDDDDASSVGTMPRLCSIHYWAVALPIGLLSAWFILSRQPLQTTPPFLKRIELAFDKAVYGWKRKAAYALFMFSPFILLFTWISTHELETSVPFALILVILFALPTWLLQSRQPAYPHVSQG